MNASRPRLDTPSMTREELELLGSVEIASPCPMNWNDLQGDDKKRHCSQCNLHVYKVSAMTTAEAVALFQKVRSERVCAQLFHRMDGTVMTKDCPSAWAVGLRKAVRRIGRPTGIVAGALVFVLAVFLTFVTFLATTSEPVRRERGRPRGLDRRHAGHANLQGSAALTILPRMRKDSALPEAAFDDDVATVKRLVKSGVRLESVDESGQTALGNAALAGNVALVKFLLAAGANAKHVSKKWKSSALTSRQRRTRLRW